MSSRGFEFRNILSFDLRWKRMYLCRRRGFGGGGREN